MPDFPVQTVSIASPKHCYTASSNQESREIETAIYAPTRCIENQRHAQCGLQSHPFVFI
jgi:hypothetical protein